MDKIIIPEAGLALHSASNSDDPSNPVVKPTQVIQLNLSDGTLEEILKEARNGGKDGQVSFGKAPVCLPAFDFAKIS